MRTAALQALAACLCLSAATPPAWLPGAGLLVIPGLMALYAAVTKGPRPYLLAYLVLALVTLWFSWSLRHVVMAGWAAIGLVAGLYGLLMVLWMRGLTRLLPAPAAFALAVAGTQWLRAHMVQFPYPHGQPGHALYPWPALLGAVRWGGEPLVNAILAGLSGVAVDLYRSWRVADPPWRTASRSAGLWLAAAVLLSAIPPPAAAGEPTTVRIAAIEPGLENDQVFGGSPWAAMLPRLRSSTDGLAAGWDLILWPESSLPAWVEGGRLQSEVPLHLPALPPGTRLLAGASARRSAERFTPASVLLDEAGVYLAHQEKSVLVPVGEFIPFTDWLPEGLRRTVLGWIAGFAPWVPDELPGRWRPPLTTGGGVSFGALICFDNAFDTVVRRHVHDGARFLVVLSNEAWYLGGDELEQMVAMTVFRALETGTPLVRGTVDGVSLLVDGRGRILERLPAPSPSSPPAPRVLEVMLQAGPGRLPPMAWVSDATLGLVLISGVAALLRAALASGRLRVSPSVASVAGPPEPPPEGGS